MPIIDPRITALLEQYKDLLKFEELRDCLSSISLLKNAGGWGEVTLVFKGGDATDTRITITSKTPKADKKG